MGERAELPQGWELVKLKQVVATDGVFIDGDWVESKDQDPEGDIRLIQLADVGDGNYRNRSNRFMTLEKATKLNCTFMQAGDVLVARMPDPLGRACIFPGDEKQAVTVVDVCIIRTGKFGVDHRWLMNTLNSSVFRASIAALQSGSTRLRISRKNLETIEFPLPPLPEQRRIVAKLEELFSRLDAGVAAVRRTQALLKRYRQSVLHAAVTGELTRAWREAHPAPTETGAALLTRIRAERRAQWEAAQVAKRGGQLPLNDAWKSKYVEPAAPDTSELPELPAGWVWSTLGNLLINRDGERIPVNSSERAKRQGDFDYYGASGVIDKVDDFLFDKPLLLIGEDGANLLSRSTPIAFIAKGKYWVNNHAHVLDAESILTLDFAKNYVNSIDLTPFVTGTAQPKLNQAKLNGIPIPVPPLAEQAEIVAEVERRLTVLDALSQTLTAELKRAERL
ncbi:restriction endonuclease subunit S, partial [Hymenobacter lapidarius]|uniref:restriction endonuclease subunit S n=1 Tax=Hymenobacter lapidarius TaxID=1908237 RepID=UPI0008A5F18E